jgi:S-formylglutathione hydrolase FrmB
VFGVAGAWVLAPTRHGAHNWEGIGMRSATCALEALGRWGGGDDMEGRGVDAGRVLFAGHSMGGHGAWVISTHFPDLALGVASAAGWIRKVSPLQSTLVL